MKVGVDEVTLLLGIILDN